MSAPRCTQIMLGDGMEWTVSRAQSALTSLREQKPEQDGWRVRVDGRQLLVVET